ncbi:hypothetical protein LEP1GSC132_0480 [Leptospira kirschneri str. 200803703]|uniref:Uncharacterized protein n=2 Tax=Leptospira kirschneri str. 200802841 TaxID=1193047 RepID=A0A828XWW1_9LEPT|nr:hypothetical protein [Leptospira kirschneri]EKO49686.1 hypothetical protein LEP1GSC131_0140 [Leptospira kirschneri str. 200802841]EKO50134.1 hypothetical protein LEP1GSC131_2616 [Leptospira kirschneri str. 200802841]EKO53601.1 hypothetical protein LEP1GSC131_0910 [Leptospira kirschneri str. 200802841]EMO68057.1 hypothetical protein LEP1GSC132_0255 [Leptospira kirschneri str. 200803703]EMO68144.1 hypothetical protein LEP1GSC132_0480 [Leptospira kirschneri str. 200803703]
MPKKIKKNKTTKQTPTKTPNAKKLSSVAEVWSEEESSVTVEESRELALPESTTPVPLITPEQRRTRLNYLMSQIGAGTEMIRVGQETVLVALAEVNREQLYLEVPGCAGMEQFVNDNTVFEWWKIEKALPAVDKLFSSEINRKTLGGKSDKVLLRIIEGLREDNALFEDGEVRFPDGRVMGLSDYEKSFTSKNQKEFSKILSDKDKRIGDLENQVTNTRNEAASYKASMDELHKIVDDQTKDTGISPEVRRAFRERRELSEILMESLNSIQSQADVILAAHDSDFSKLEHSLENGKVVSIFLTSLSGIYRSIYEKWSDCLPVPMMEDLG